MDHPLVGLKIVENSPNEGEVARSLIASTFERFEIVSQFDAWPSAWSRGTWIIHKDSFNVITSVHRV